MYFDELRDVPPALERCIVINVSTDVVTSLALASAVRHAQMPVLLVNCSAGPASKVLMETLGAHWGFDLLDLRTNTHGRTLDYIFSELATERIFLLDSDAEIRDPNIVRDMRRAFDQSDVFGSGSIEPYYWFPPTGERTFPMLIVQRPFIPCSMFRTSHIRYALSQGVSFLSSDAIGAGLKVAELPPADLMVGVEHLASFYDTGSAIFHKMCIRDSGDIETPPKR